MILYSGGVASTFLQHAAPTIWTWVLRDCQCDSVRVVQSLLNVLPRPVRTLPMPYSRRPPVQRAGGLLAALSKVGYTLLSQHLAHRS